LDTSTHEVVIVWPLLLWTAPPLDCWLAGLASSFPRLPRHLDLTAVSDLHPGAFKILCALHNQARTQGIQL
jgi:hypothetical protein